jgi:hypothetical protein
MISLNSINRFIFVMETVCFLWGMIWVGFEVLTAETIKSRRIRRARNQGESRWRTELVSCSDYFSTLKMEAICSSETSVETQRTTRRYIPEDDTLHNHRSENLKSYIIFLYWEATQWFITSTLNMEAICSSETSVETTDYTASYIRRW